MRLIDADALFEGKPPIKVIFSGMLDSKDAVRILNDAIKVYHDALEKAPTIDALPVVRCKDCVHAAELEGYPKRRFENGLNCMACRGDNGYGIANLSLTTPDGYCDDGVLRWDSEDK